MRAMVFSNSCRNYNFISHTLLVVLIWDLIVYYSVNLQWHMYCLTNNWILSLGANALPLIILIKINGCIYEFHVADKGIWKWYKSMHELESSQRTSDAYMCK